nr:hypothetical protein BaRGS_004192 [Batillaria attramentaria]
MERSLRNLTNSHSRFEQQLEQHQQLLVEQQQKSLHEFNEAIRREIDTDAKVQEQAPYGQPARPQAAQDQSVRKKAVRFADLHYEEEVEEDNDSADSMTDVTVAKENIQQDKKSVLPSHSHFSGTNNNNAYKAVYNENGLRIDRTPTDDEINNLWMNMRSILEMGSEKGGPPSASASAAMTTNNNNNIEQPPASRQTVQLSNKYIDVTESMAGFLAAEQMVQTHGTAIRDSRVVAAMESAQQQQEAYNSLREKYAKVPNTSFSGGFVKGEMGVFEALLS